MEDLLQTTKSWPHLLLSNARAGNMQSGHCRLFPQNLNLLSLSRDQYNLRDRPCDLQPNVIVSQAAGQTEQAIKQTLTELAQSSTRMALAA